ncbi:MAG: arginine decarboxylase, pyruvoyl-dependent [Thermoplasmatales archaeon]|nr:MAG: arginine decarboxylase, pyruvoyl-dependent [Thermoplasmatales archaeon]
MVPKKVFFTKGVGVHKDGLQSFELALRSAGIEKCNIVTVSSIVPPRCKIISRDRGTKQLKPGEITYCVMSKNNTDEANRLVGASIGIAIPKEKESYGYISEHHCYGDASKNLGDYAEDLAATMLATTLGIDFDPDKAWDERKHEFKMSGMFVRTQSIAQTARGQGRGVWTTVIAAAVFLEE